MYVFVSHSSFLILHSSFFILNSSLIMSIFQSLIKKEMLHLLRDFRTVTVVLVMPVVLLLLFGFAISTEVNNVKVVAVVEQHTDETKQIIGRFRNNSYFTFEGVVTHNDVESLLRKGLADAAIVFRTESGKLKHQIVVDASNTTMAQTSTAYLENVIAMMTSVSIVSEKETGTMNLLLVSPVHPRTIILGKLVPYFLLSCIILTLVLVLGYTVLGLPFSFSVINVIWVTILYVVLALALGLLISTIASTQVSALLVSGVMFMIPVVLLSGMIFPVENMPLALQWFSCIIPARWYISAMRVLMIQQLPVGYVLTEVLVLSGMTVAVLALAIKKFNAKK